MIDISIPAYMLTEISMRSIQELQQEDGGVKIIYFNLAIHVQCRDFKVAKTLFGVLLDDII